MKKNVRDLAEILGIFAVVASLIFVGMQLQLDRKIAIAEQYANRAESAKEDIRTSLLSPEYFRFYQEYWDEFGEFPIDLNGELDLLDLVREGKLSITSVEAIILGSVLDIIGYDNLYFQYQQGLLSEAAWLDLRESLKQAMSNYEVAFLVYQQASRATIEPVIEEIVAEIESERATQAE